MKNKLIKLISVLLMIPLAFSAVGCGQVVIPEYTYVPAFHSYSYTCTRVRIIICGIGVMARTERYGRQRGPLRPLRRFLLRVGDHSLLEVNQLART